MVSAGFLPPHVMMTPDVPMKSQEEVKPFKMAEINNQSKPCNGFPLSLSEYLFNMLVETTQQRL